MSKKLYRLNIFILFFALQKISGMEICNFSYRLALDKIKQAIMARNYKEIESHPEWINQFHITHWELAQKLALGKGISEPEVDIFTFIDMHMPKPMKLSALDKIKLLK